MDKNQEETIRRVLRPVIPLDEVDNVRMPAASHVADMVQKHDAGYLMVSTNKEGVRGWLFGQDADTLENWARFDGDRNVVIYKIVKILEDK